jgi:Tol biopolymer transport system component
VHEFSPDGTELLATSDVGSDDSYSLALTVWPLSERHGEGHARTLAIDKRYNLWQGHYSPDEKWVAFVAQKLDGTGLVVEVLRADRTNAGEREWTPITDQLSFADKPRWSPDGRLLYFTVRNGAFWNLWARHFDPEAGKPSGPPFEVTHFDSLKLQLSPYVQTAEIGVSRQRLTLTMMERTGNIWIADNVDR